MCGIIGYSGKDPVDISDFKILMLYSQIRGDEASGFATSKILTKDDSTASYLIAKHKIPETNLIIGHTRNSSIYTTKNQENAQPFRYDKLVGAHNGYISNHFKLRTATDAAVGMSDSYYAYLYMNRFGVETALKEFEGGYALIWINIKDNTLNLYRKNNPIFNAQKNGNILIASQSEYLEAIDCDNIEPVKEHTWVVIKDGVVKKTKEIKPKVASHTHSRRVYPSQEVPERYSPLERNNHKVPLKIDAVHAPDGADIMWIKGNKHFYWINDKDVLSIEQVFSYKNSKLDKFDLTLDLAVKSAHRMYKPIINKVLEDND